jgi:LPPG:FO 2-phospho-L-lactate transferase
MSDQRVQTRLRTADGSIDFQDYFVRLGCAPEVLEVSYDGAAKARVLPEIIQALDDPDLRAVVICPSNPYLSIDPMLNVPGLWEALANCHAPVVAVSPIIRGEAVKGPTAKMMREMGAEASARAVAQHYGELLDGYIVDEADASSCRDMDISIVPAQTLMVTLEDREALARTVLMSADAVAEKS